MNDVLIFILLIILIFGIITLGVMIITSNKKHIDRLLEENSKNANEINMRLISLMTEVILNSEPITQREIDELNQDIIAKDELIKESAFDPFETSRNINLTPEDLEDNIDEDILMSKSSIVK